MSWISRVKSGVTGGIPMASVAVETIKGVVSLRIPEDINTVLVTNSSATVVNVVTASIRPGRRITLIGNASATITMTNNNGTTTAYQMDLAGSNRSFVLDSVISLIQLSSGAWRLDGLNL